MDKLISIVTCVYNGSLTIEDTILSVIYQNYKNFELLIVDGLSKDNTLDIVGKYSKKDERIKIISEKDDGIYDAYNKGIRNSSGEIILFVNADDFLFPNALFNISKKFNTKNYSVFAGSIAILNEKEHYYKKHLRSEIAKHSLTNPTILTPGICFHKDIFTDIGYFDTSYKICADFDFISRCINNDVKIQYSDFLINNMREGGVSSDMKFERTKKMEHLKVFNRNSKNINFRFYIKIIKNYIKTIILNYLFRTTLERKRKSIQDNYIVDKIFWYRKHTN